MKLLKLTIENFMRIVAIEITPKGNAILITGKNAAGKSSILEAIRALFKGKKYHPDKPIRDGEDHAEIIGETENFIIKRTFTKSGGGSVTVTNADGMKATSAQGLLAKFYGEFAFEPMEFYKDCKKVEKQREQLYTLMKLVGLDFTDIDQEIVTVKAERSVVKNSKDTYDFEASKIMKLDNMPTELVSMAELTEKLTVATRLNAKHTDTVSQIDAGQKGIEDLIGRTENNETNLATSTEQLKQIDRGYNARCSALKSEFAAHLEQELKNWEQSIESLTKQLEIIKTGQASAKVALEEAQAKQEALVTTLEPLIDVATINEEIKDADAKNESIRGQNQRTDLLKKSAAKSGEFAELGKGMKGLEAKKAKRLASAKMPIDGLSVNEDTILYDNIPLAQVNESMQLRISFAISMALNPKLEVILMKGNDLDSASLDIVCKMAEEKGYDVWIEKVDESGKVGFYIEDGSLVAVDGVAVKPPTKKVSSKETVADKDELFTDKE